MARARLRAIPFLFALLFLAPTSSLLAPGSALSSGKWPAIGVVNSVYATREPGKFAIKLVVRADRIAYMRVEAVEDCEGGAQVSSAAVSPWGSSLAIGRDGEFEARWQSERWGEERLVAHYQRREITGSYRVRGRDQEVEEWDPRCGTESPWGQPIHFVAPMVRPLRRRWG